MRIPIYCPNVQGYIENPKDYLPSVPECLNNHAHRPTWNTHWKRGLILDHVHVTEILIFNAYCETCHETISYWPNFVLPYVREPVETGEKALVEHLQGTSIKEIADGIGYDLRTVSRWIKLTLTQSLSIFDRVVRRILYMIGNELLPLSFTTAKEATTLLLAWLRKLAEWIGYSQVNRLMGLCNLMGKGDWNLWGAPLGRARSRVGEIPSPG